SVDSHFISVNPSSIKQHDFGNGLPVISVEITVSANAPTGDYTIRLNSNTGETACLAGALSIEGMDATDELGQLFIAPADALEGYETTLVGENVFMLTGENAGENFVADSTEAAQTELSFIVLEEPLRR
ncbi:MAG: hypothetical protein ICV68_08255, partial [Pyrinomonadaceae bacterium]|nr:hypothetical protein [Pyrinomonadaceae bacterium]